MRVLQYIKGVSFQSRGPFVNSLIGTPHHSHTYRKFPTKLKTPLPANMMTLPMVLTQATEKFDTQPQMKLLTNTSPVCLPCILNIIDPPPPRQLGQPRLTPSQKPNATVVRTLQGATLYVSPLIQSQKVCESYSVSSYFPPKHRHT